MNNKNGGLRGSHVAAAVTGLVVGAGVVVAAQTALQDKENRKRLRKVVGVVRSNIAERIVPKKTTGAFTASKDLNKP